jgi:FG-GAP repeat protein
LKNTVQRALFLVTAFLICTGALRAADLHPIVEVQSGYLFGAISDGKWIKADETANLVTGETTYRVYGLTQALGDAKGGKPKPVEGAPCEETLAVSLSPKPEKGVMAIAAPWNALPRKAKVIDPTVKVYVDAVRDFLKTKGIEQAKVKIDNILGVDLDGDGEEEVLISATNYLSKDGRVPMRSPAGSYSMVLLRRMVAGKVETQLVEGEFHSKAYPRKGPDDASFDAPNAYKVIAVLDLDGDGKMEIVVGSNYYEGEEITIYGYDPKKSVPLLSVACGA